MKRNHLLLSACLFLCLLPVACQPTAPPANQQETGKDAVKENADHTNPATKEAAKIVAPAPTLDRSLLQPALLQDKAPEVFDVKFTTTRGEFTVRVTRAWSPLGADRFYNLVQHHFYDGAVFFRVVDGFVAQFGISPFPEVSAAWKNAKIKDDPVIQSNVAGTVAFATDGPNTRTTQIFISMRNNSHLDSLGFSPFGKVTDGTMAVVMLYGGYGDEPSRGGTGPEQDKLEKRGNAYVDKGPRAGNHGEGWPKLDKIITAAVVPASK